ncbi:MAG: C-terminal binding protein, partial [bacterium]
VEREALGADAEMVFLDSRQEQDYDPEILKSLDALLVWRAKITSKTVDQLERCRIVVRYGVGYDTVDLTSLKNKGIPFCNV